MSEAPENKPPATPPSRKPGRASRQRSAWRKWDFSRITKPWRALTDRFYIWWYPPSNRQWEGYGYGPSRKNRIVRIWQRLQRIIKYSAVSRGYRKLSALWWNWWYPPSDHRPERTKNRAERALDRADRWIRNSAVGRGYRKLTAKWMNWWYPPSDRRSERSENRMERSINRLNRWFGNSFVGRWHAQLSARWWKWWYPPSARRSGRDENRLEQSLRLLDRWIRKTWLGKKLAWVLDDAVELYTLLRRQFLEIYNSKPFQKKIFRWQTAAWCAALLALPMVAYTYGWPQFRRYQEVNYARQAQDLLAAGDLRRATIRCQQVFAVDFKNAIATRIFAEVADSYGSPIAIYWRQRALLLDSSITNQIALASTAVRLEPFPFPTATKILGEIAPTYQQTAEYQRVAGALALRLSKTQEAEHHFLEAYNLDPENPVNRMSLAVIRLQSKDAKVNTDSRTALALLMNNGQVGLLATRSLVAESIDRGDLKGAESLSLQLLQNARSSFSDRILHLVILKASHSTNFTPFLKQTEERARDKIALVGALASWLNNSGYARESLDWLHQLPPEFTRQGLLPIAIADAYAGLGQWNEMEQYLRSRPWPGQEHLRFAMIALCNAKQTGSQQDSVAWQSAIQFGANSPDALNMLSKLSSAWGWPERTLDLLWFANQRYPDQRWPLTSLDEYYVAKGDTSGMWRVAKTSLVKNPGDQKARNNYAMISLLLEADTATACQYASELYSAEPQNPNYASTYAFSLYKLGRAKEGLKVLRDLPAQQLDNPAMAVYYGILLAASGDALTAKHYLNQSSKAFLLPEEKDLVARAKTGLIR